VNYQYEISIHFVVPKLFYIGAKDPNHTVGYDIDTITGPYNQSYCLEV